MRIGFRFDEYKADQAVLWLLSAFGSEVEKRKLLQLAYFADREHLRKFGRPIIGGDYVAMHCGVVSWPLAYRIDYGDARVPYRPTEDGAVRTRYPGRRPSWDALVLSASDLDVLEGVTRQFGCHSSARLLDEIGGDRAWRDHRPQDYSSPPSPVPCEDIIEDEEMIEIIRENQSVREALHA